MIKLYENWINEKTSNFNIDDLKYGHSAYEFEDKVIKSSFLRDWSEESGFCEEIVKSCPLNSSKQTLKELEEILQMMKDVTVEKIQFAKLAEEDHLQLFVDFVNSKGHKANVEELKSIVHITDPLLFCLKEKVNRPRPFQLSYYLNVPIYPLIVTNAMHAAYPSGHSLDSANFGRYYAYKYPDIAKEVADYAQKIAETRMYCGFHYRSDHEISIYISDVIWKNSNFIEYIQKIKKNSEQ